MTGLQKIDSTLDLLMRARERLSDRKNWTQNPTGKCGDARCLGYTLIEINGWANGTSDALCAIGKHLGGVHLIPEWNDRHAHSDVLALLDRVIAERVC
jgi:hypothetical protein